MTSSVKKASERIVLITGGAGFIGTNLANRFALEDYRVRIFDNLSRSGVGRNLQWLLDEHSDRIEFHHEDVRDLAAVKRAVCGTKIVYHLAAQVAVTTSLAAPLEDFGINVRGTLNVLEAMRTQSCPPALIFTSTNKVYGSLEDLPLHEKGERYQTKNFRYRSISEERPLDFHSPYGCSKGAADQYVRDYARSFGLQTIVLRMSCIYGAHQFGNEDQGWVAHFLIRALNNDPIVIYGNGKQVRDILYVDDLVNACWLAFQNRNRLAGNVFNIGGGPTNTVSLLELLKLIGSEQGSAPKIAFGAVRQGDQRYFVSDTGLFSQRTGWQARVTVEEGVRRLRQWLADNRNNQLEPVLARVAA
jgi:CDP-paratose 2-epimerase